MLSDSFVFLFSVGERILKLSLLFYLRAEAVFASSRVFGSYSLILLVTIVEISFDLILLL